jgi:hypothetical protein
MENQDLSVDLRSVEGGFEAAVPGEEAGPPFSDPIGEKELEELHAEYDATGEELQARRKELTCRQQEIGKRLSGVLFQNGLWERFRRLREAAQQSGGRAGLRLRFRLDGPRADYLAALPWEWITDSETGRFLAADRCTPVVREILDERQGPVRALGEVEFELLLRILIVDSLPTTEKPIDLKLEVRRMEAALRPLWKQGEVDPIRLTRPSRDELCETLLNGNIHVFHFMGHAGYSPETGRGAIALEKPDRTADLVDGLRLASFLKGIPNLRLVVLNSCKTARYKGCMAPLNGVAAAVLRETRVPAVVANQLSISNSAAVELSRIFYGRIAGGAGVDEALTEARMRTWDKSAEWATSVLFLNGPDGKIFRLKPGDCLSAVRVTPHQIDDPVELGVRSFDGYGQSMDLRTDEVLDLLDCFEGRYIKNPDWWQERIFPRLREFLKRRVKERRPVVLEFAAHTSIAFAAGWWLRPKSGMEVRVRQRIGNDGERDLRPDDGLVPEGPLWLERPDIVLDPEAPDIAVAVSIAQSNVADHVKEYIETNGLSISRILDVTIAPEPGHGSVQGGAHAWRLAETLLPRLKERRPHERRGRVHFFCAAPNVFMVYLGQLAAVLGSSVLYEYPIGAKEAYGRYQKSIELPPPDEARPIPWD